MKKLINSMFALAIAAFTLTSCEDVPMPYDITFEKDNKTPDPSDMEAKGTGTKDDPFNIVAAQNYITKGEGLDKEVYVKGIVVSVQEINTQYGNATYYISDDGTTTNQFYVFRGKALGNVKFTDSNKIKKGDKVVICGKLMTHTNGVKQLGQGNYIYSLNGQVQETTPPTNTGLNVTFDNNIANFTIVNVKALPEGLTKVWFHDANFKQMKATGRANNTNYATQSRELFEVSCSQRRYQGTRFYRRQQLEACGYQQSSFRQELGLRRFYLRPESVCRSGESIRCIRIQQYKKNYHDMGN